LHVLSEGKSLQVTQLLIHVLMHILLCKTDLLVEKKLSDYGR